MVKAFIVYSLRRNLKLPKNFDANKAEYSRNKLLEDIFYFNDEKSILEYKIGEEFYVIPKQAIKARKSIANNAKFIILVSFDEKAKKIIGHIK